MIWAIILVLVVLIFLILNLKTFGSKPKGLRLEKIKSLKNYKGKELHNLEFTPMKPEGMSYFSMLKGFFFNKSANNIPKDILPSKVSDFNKKDITSITWFGHSSYLIQIDSKNILVDPVFNTPASPFNIIGGKPFKGADFVDINQLPFIDIILITHDHYDHLAHHTIMQLHAKNTIQFVTSLGVGAHLESWGIDAANIKELAWGAYFEFKDLIFTATSSRHFSGRRFTRNQTLWSSFVLKGKKDNLFIGGDSGYGTHFKDIGNTYGPFDLAVLECGQYNTMWPYIHMKPEEVVLASMDLKASLLLPVHWSKFALALHSWKEPIERVTVAAEASNQKIVTPYLGETFSLEQQLPSENWWKNIN